MSKTAEIEVENDAAKRIWKCFDLEMLFRDNQSDTGEEFEDMESKKMLWFEIQDLVVYQVPLDPSLPDTAKGCILSPFVMQQYSYLEMQAQKRNGDFTIISRSVLQFLLDTLKQRLEEEMQNFEEARKVSWEREKINRKLNLAYIGVLAAMLLIAVILSFPYSLK